MSNANDLSKRTLTIERTFSAPIQLVWDAWTQAEHIAQWWAPKGMDVKILKHDFQVGGAWEYVMSMPDGRDFGSDGIFSEIVNLERIFTSANFRPMTEGVELQTRFEVAGEQTKMQFSVVHPSEEYCRQQEEMGFYNGWGSVFDRLEEMLTVSS